MASYVQELAATKEVDGSSLLDNTLVVLFSEVGQHHINGNIPLALFGGKSLGFQGGRCLRYGGRQVNDLWPVVARAFNVPMTTFGEPAANKGPLPEI